MLLEDCASALPVLIQSADRPQDSGKVFFPDLGHLPTRHPPARHLNLPPPLLIS
jgi:hypothetical protein